MSWTTPITDRTQANVDRVIELNSKVRNNTATASEKLEWASDLKGAFNTSDMRRIIANITLLDTVLETSLTIPVETTLPDSDWFSLLLTDVQVLRDAYCVYTKTPATPTGTINTFSKFNSIEQILLDIYTILNSNFFYYCGNQIYSGESIGLLL